MLNLAVPAVLRLVEFEPKEEFLKVVCKLDLVDLDRDPSMALFPSID